MIILCDKAVQMVRYSNFATFVSGYGLALLGVTDRCVTVFGAGFFGLEEKGMVVAKNIILGAKIQK